MVAGNEFDENKEEHLEKTEPYPNKSESRKDCFLKRFMRGECWNGLGVVISTIGIILSTSLSIILLCQTNRISSETKEINERMEIQRMKDRAREYINIKENNAELDGINEYKKLFKLDSNDKTGYCYCINKAGEASESPDPCRAIDYLDHAKEMTNDTTKIHELRDKYQQKCIKK